MMLAARKGILVGAALSLVVVVVPVGLAELMPTVAVVVNRDNPVAQLTLRELAAVYGSRSRFWQDGRSIIAINREAGSPVREVFSMVIFGRSSREMSGYWNEKYFHGIFPPLVLTSDEAVIRYLERNPQAVGYVAAGSVDDRVKVILILRPR